MRKTIGLAILLLVLVTGCDAEPAPDRPATSISPNTPAAAVSDPIVDPTVAAPAALTITPSLTPTPLPTSTPTVTPRPEARLIQAAQAVHDGDYDAAIANYQVVRDSSSSAVQRETAAIELALTQLRAGNLTDAIDAFQRFIDQYPKSERLADAWFGLGEIYFQQENWPKVIEAYQQYLRLRGNLIAGYVQERVGDAASQQGDLDLAATAYQAAVDNATTASNLAGLREKLALTDRLAKNYSAPLSQYDQILSFSHQPAYRAQFMYQA